MDEGGGVAEAGADKDGTAADGPEGVDVRPRDEDADGDQRADGEGASPAGDALGPAMGRIEAEDVGRSREDDGGKENVRPVGGYGAVEVLAKADENAGYRGDIKEDGIQGKVEGDEHPVLPEDAIGIHNA